MTTRQPIDYKVYRAHPRQRLFHKSLLTHDVVLFNAGRGAGKTTGGAIQSIMAASEPSRGIVVAPTYPMLRDASMAEFFHWLPAQMIRQWYKTDKLLVLKNASEIAFRSADNPDGLRGANRDWLWMDEPRNLKTREAFDIVYAQLRPKRKAWLTTTPAGIFHWLYTLFVANPIPNSEVIHARTSDNPFLPADYADVLRSQYTDKFAAQELDARWVSFEGLIFDNFSLSENVSEEAEYNPDLPVWYGVDDGYAAGSGKGHADYHPRVFLLGQQTQQGGLHIFGEYVHCLEVEEVSIANVLALPYNRPERVMVDSSAAQLKQRLWALSLNTMGATQIVTESIKNVRRLVCDGNGRRLLKIHPRCTEIIREFQSYRYDDSMLSVGGERKPAKVDDHCIDALRYMTFSMRF